jgi:ABC-type multidrug transport system ATPase subunit
MTVRDHLSFGARCSGAEVQDGLHRAVSHGLEPWLDHNAGALSTGNARKLWFVMCTLGSFDVAVLDEPFNGVDAESAEFLVSELMTWADHALVLLINHLPPEGLCITRTVTLRGRDETGDLDEQRTAIKVT